MSIVLYNQARQSGKTTKVYEMMEKDPNLVLIVPNRNMLHLVPRGLHKRTITGQEFIRHDHILRGREEERHRRAVLDEGFMYKKYDLALLYYLLGNRGWSVVTYGTDEAHPYPKPFDEEQFKREYLGHWGEQPQLNFLEAHDTTKIEAREGEFFAEERAEAEAEQQGTAGAAANDVEADAGRVDETAWTDGRTIRFARYGAGEATRVEQTGNEEPEEGRDVRESDSE